jgi:hypothetical protein
LFLKNYQQWENQCTTLLKKIRNSLYPYIAILKKEIPNLINEYDKHIANLPSQYYKKRYNFESLDLLRSKTIELNEWIENIKTILDLNLQNKFNELGYFIRNQKANNNFFSKNNLEIEKKMTIAKLIKKLLLKKESIDEIYLYNCFYSSVNDDERQTIDVINYIATILKLRKITSQKKMLKLLKKEEDYYNACHLHEAERSRKKRMKLAFYKTLYFMIGRFDSDIHFGEQLFHLTKMAALCIILVIASAQFIHLDVDFLTVTASSYIMSHWYLVFSTRNFFKEKINSLSLFEDSKKKYAETIASIKAKLEGIKNTLTKSETHLNKLNVPDVFKPLTLKNLEFKPYKTKSD